MAILNAASRHGSRSSAVICRKTEVCGNLVCEIDKHPLAKLSNYINYRDTSRI